MIENVSTQLTVFHCLCPLPAYRKGLRLPLRSALFGEGGRDWRPCKCPSHNEPEVVLLPFPTVSVARLIGWLLVNEKTGAC